MRENYAPEPRRSMAAAVGKCPSLPAEQRHFRYFCKGSVSFPAKVLSIKRKMANRQKREKDARISTIERKLKILEFENEIDEPGIGR
jgi:hypothetical protein